MKQKIHSIANEVIIESERSRVFTHILDSVFSFAKKDFSQNRNSQNKKLQILLLAPNTANGRV